MRNGRAIAPAIREARMKSLVFVRRGRPIDWFNMLVIRFVLFFFVCCFVGCQAFAPELFCVHQFLQRSRCEVTRFVKPSWSRWLSVCGKDSTNVFRAAA